MRQDKMTTVPILLPGLLSRKGQNNACARDLHFARDTFTIIRLSARHTFKPERWDWDTANLNLQERERGGEGGGGGVANGVGDGGG